MVKEIWRETCDFWLRGLDLLFPPRCAGCQCDGYLLCPACLQTMQPLEDSLCPDCSAPLPPDGKPCQLCQRHRLALHSLNCLNDYRGPLRSTIHALKYDGQKRLAEPLGQLLARIWQRSGLRADGIVPLPLHYLREQERGSNQATLLARVCARRLHIPCLEHLLIRQRATRAQVGLSATERRQNVAGAFSLAAGFTALPQGRTLILLDDVCTTGATLEAGSVPLYEAGVACVHGLVLARPLLIA